MILGVNFVDKKIPGWGQLIKFYLKNARGIDGFVV